LEISKNEFASCVCGDKMCKSRNGGSDLICATRGAQSSTKLDNRGTCAQGFNEISSRKACILLRIMVEANDESIRDEEFWGIYVI
jgi:hypothetical protein